MTAAFCLSAYTMISAVTSRSPTVQEEIEAQDKVRQEIQAKEQAELRRRLPFANHVIERNGKRFAVVLTPGINGSFNRGCGMDDAFTAFDVTDPEEPKHAVDFCANVTPSVIATHDNVMKAFEEKMALIGTASDIDAVRSGYSLYSQVQTSTTPKLD